MGKRSDYPRNERDFYPTPAKAVLPLIPYFAASGPSPSPAAAKAT
jgi:hypothetical protein